MGFGVKTTFSIIYAIFHFLIFRFEKIFVSIGL